MSPAPTPALTTAKPATTVVLIRRVIDIDSAAPISGAIVSINGRYRAPTMLQVTTPYAACSTREAMAISRMCQRTITVATTATFQAQLRMSGSIMCNELRQALRLLCPNPDVQFLVEVLER